MFQTYSYQKTLTHLPCSARTHFPHPYIHNSQFPHFLIPRILFPLFNLIFLQISTYLHVIVSPKKISSFLRKNKQTFFEVELSTIPTVCSTQQVLNIDICVYCMMLHQYLMETTTLPLKPYLIYSTCFINKFSWVDLYQI